MSIFFTLFSVIFGLLSGLVFSNFSGAQSKANDTLTKNDINSIFQKLEEHYNENGEYPTVEEVVYESEENLPGIDSEALYDINGNIINSGLYMYSPTDCTAIGCKKYTLTAELEDRTTYTKYSLN